MVGTATHGQQHSSSSEGSSKADGQTSSFGGPDRMPHIPGDRSLQAGQHAAHVDRLVGAHEAMPASLDDQGSHAVDNPDSIGEQQTFRQQLLWQWELQKQWHALKSERQSNGLAASHLPSTSHGSSARLDPEPQPLPSLHNTNPSQTQPLTSTTSQTHQQFHEQNGSSACVPWTRQQQGDGAAQHTLSIGNSAGDAHAAPQITQQEQQHHKQGQEQQQDSTALLQEPNGPSVHWMGTLMRQASALRRYAGGSYTHTRIHHICSEPGFIPSHACGCHSQP